MSIIYQSDFSKQEEKFIKNGKGKVYIEDNKLYLDDTDEGTGLTCWLNEEFNGNIEISFEAMAIKPRLASNINFFFMAKPTDGNPKDILSFSGNYAEYHEKADLYIVTMTGDFENLHGKSNKGYSRFRKDPGFNLINESRDIKTELNKLYRFNIIKKDKDIVIKINDKVIHQYEDTSPYNKGLLGFRTYYTKLRIDNFIVKQLD